MYSRTASVDRVEAEHHELAADLRRHPRRGEHLARVRLDTPQRRRLHAGRRGREERAGELEHLSDEPVVDPGRHQHAPADGRPERARRRRPHGRARTSRRRWRSRGRSSRRRTAAPARRPRSTRPRHPRRRHAGARARTAPASGRARRPSRRRPRPGSRCSPAAGADVEEVEPGSSSARSSTRSPTGAIAARAVPVACCPGGASPSAQLFGSRHRATLTRAWSGCDGKLT